MVNEKHWLKLTQIIAHIANKEIEIEELRGYCDDLSEWEFITARLTKLGLVYFKSLHPNYNEMITSEKIAKEDYGDNEAGWNSEMELLHAMPKCVGGINTRLDYPFLVPFDETPKGLPKPDFYLGCGFIENDLGEPVFFVA
jgi:hypothetical protein